MKTKTKIVILAIAAGALVGVAYQAGLHLGYDRSGVSQVADDAYDAGYDDGYEAGYEAGYTDGFAGQRPEFSGLNASPVRPLGTVGSSLGFLMMAAFGAVVLGFVGGMVASSVEDGDRE